MAQSSLAPSTKRHAFGAHLPELRVDPYGVYRRFREQDPVHWSGDSPGLGAGAWYLFRHKDAQQALKSPALGRRASAYLPGGSLGALMARWLVFRNPPDHTRIRSAMHRAFTPAAVRRLEESARRLACELVEGLHPGQRIDLLEALASPLPTLVIAEILGIAAHDHPRFRRWSAALAPSLDMVHTPTQLRAAASAAGEMREYVRRAADERRQRPREDVLSALVAPVEGAEPLGEDDLLANCVFLLAAGHETTTHVIGTGVRALLIEQEPWERLVAEPGLAAGATEELLRWEAPVQITFRDALEELELDGRRILPGHQVAAVLGAANRDPEVFPDPDRLDITRHNAHQNLTFSSGIHYCLGAALARMEIAVALEALTSRWPGTRLDGDPIWRSSVLLRGLDSLPVVVTS